MLPENILSNPMYLWTLPYIPKNFSGQISKSSSALSCHNPTWNKLPHAAGSWRCGDELSTEDVHFFKRFFICPFILWVYREHWLALCHASRVRRLCIMFNMQLVFSHKHLNILRGRWDVWTSLVFHSPLCGSSSSLRRSAWCGCWRCQSYLLYRY